MSCMLHLTTVEKETYELLQKLNSIEIVSSNFALAGGTSLALQIGHRQSIDLDFFSTATFNVRELEITLAGNDSINFQLINSNSRMLFCYINNIKCDFVNEPATLINPFLNIENIPFFSVEDIAAMKLHTICGRGKKKDFFDIYALLQFFSWKDLLNFFKKKYSEDQLYFLWRSIIYFDDADQDPDINGLQPFNRSWEDVKEIILTKCRN
jgi:predicted nucleotidyltransferase component of viral defense system